MLVSNGARAYSLVEIFSSRLCMCFFSAETTVPNLRSPWPRDEWSSEDGYGSIITAPTTHGLTGRHKSLASQICIRPQRVLTPLSHLLLVARRSTRGLSLFSLIFPSFLIFLQDRSGVCMLRCPAKRGASCSETKRGHIRSRILSAYYVGEPFSIRWCPARIFERFCCDR